MKELRERGSDYERWLQPFDDDVDVMVLMKSLSPSEQGKIYDYCGIRINDPGKNTWAKWEQANKMTVDQQVKDWRGFTDGGQPLPCNTRTKERLLTARFKATTPDGDSRRLPLWQILNNKFEELEEQEEKNSSTPPSSDSVAAKTSATSAA